MKTTLPISRLIKVNVTLTAAAAQAQDINTLLILGSTSGVIDVVERMRAYSSLAQVAGDFGGAAPEYLAAVLWFEQKPQPTNLLIGRWAQGATHGKLLGGPLSATQQLLGLWRAVSDGAVTLTVDGTPQNITGLNFSTVQSMNAVASTINGLLAGAAVQWNSVYQRFEVTSTSTGANSSVAFATAGTGVGVTDVSGMLGLTQATSGAYVANGIAAEAALDAVTLFDVNYGQQWYAVTVLGASDEDHLQIGPYVEGTTTKHFYGVTTQEATVLTPGDTTDVAYNLQQLGLDHTAVQYSSTNPYAVVSLLARILTTDWQANNSAITLMYKQEPGIVPEYVNETQIEALEAKNCNVFASYNNDTAIIEPGKSSSGQFIDSVIGADALAVDIQTAVYNLLYTSPTKIPQTDDGTHSVMTAISQVCNQYVSDGFLAPGTWNSAGFGSLAQGATVPKGYYIYAPPVSSQTEAQRQSRISVPIQIAAKQAGAVHGADVSITVNA